MASVLSSARFVYTLNGKHEHTDWHKQHASIVDILSRGDAYAMSAMRILFKTEQRAILAAEAVRLAGQPSRDETKGCTLLYRRLFPELQPFRGRSS